MLERRISRILQGALIAAGSLVFVSCGEKEEVKKEVPKKTIKVAYRYNKSWQDYFDVVKANYEMANPETTVVISPITATESDYFAKAALLLKSDSSIDVMMEDTFTLRGDVDAGFLSPIENIEKWPGWDEFYDGVKKAGEVDGKLYGIPFTSDTRGIFYNKKIIQSLGLPEEWQPKNWDEIMATAEKIKEKYPDVLPFWFYGGMGEAATMQTFQMFMYGTKDKMYEDGKWVIESKGMLDSLKFLGDMTKKGLSAKPSLATSQKGEAQIWEKMFAEGKVAMLLGGGWNTMNFQYYKEGREQAFKDYGITKMPNQAGDGFNSMSGGWLFSIPKLSKNKEQALEFIKFATEKEQLINLFSKSGEIAPRKDLGKMKEYEEVDPLRIKATQFLDFTNYRPANSEYPAVSVEIQKALESVVLGVSTPEEAMKKYGDAVEKIVGKERVIKK